MPEKDDLLKMFDLGSKPTEVKTSKLPSFLTDELEYDLSKSANSLVLDEWDVEKGKILKETSQHDDEVNRLTSDDWADLHGLAYIIDPMLVDKPYNERKTEFIKQLMDTPDFQVLHKSTASNEVASKLAAQQFALSFQALFQKDKEQRERIKRHKGKVDAKKEEAKASRSLVQAVNQSLKQATADVQELEETCRSIGIDPTDPSRQDAGKINDLFQRIRNTPRLRRIAELAGRFIRCAQSNQQRKITHGYDDMVGVEMGNDVGRLLPVELARLSDPILEMDASRRFVERQTACRQYKGIEKVGKGPIVLCCDESGSMNGERICQAKAFALGLAWVAKHQKRYCCLVSYAAERSGIKLCVLPPNNWNESELLDWLTHFFGGGTSLIGPLNRLPFEMWGTIKAPKGKTDIILLTDGEVELPHELKTNFNEWKKKEQVRMISLIIHGRGDTLRPVSDECYSINSVDLEQPGVQRCLSI